MKPRLLIALLSLASLAAFAAAPAGDPIELARVNGDVVTDADLKQAFVGKHGGHTTFLGGAAEARRFLDIVINERLLIQEAYALGLDQDPAVKPQVDEFRDRKASEALLKAEIEDKAVPTADEIRAAWEVAGELFIAREIVVDSQQEAESIRRMVLGGSDFEAVARACSASATRTRGGSLPPFTWGSHPLALEEAAFTLQPGEVSTPVRTKEGWTLLFMIDRSEAVRPELDQKVSARIAARLTERNREARAHELSERLWKKYEAAVAPGTVDAAGLARTMAKAPESIVATWKGGSLTLGQAFTPEEVRMFAALPPAQAADQIDSTLRAAVNTALVKEEARQRKIAETPAVASAVEKFESGLIEGVLYSKHVLTGLRVDDAEVRAAYEAEEGRLLVGEKRRVAHIALATAKEAEAVLARLKKGEDFADLLEALSLDQSSVKTEGDLGWIEKGKVAEKYDVLFRLPVGGVSPPIRSDSAWHLVRVTAIEPEQQLSFEAAQEAIRRNLLEKKKHDARERWIARLREAGEIEVIEAGIEKFVALHPYEDPND